MGGYLLLNLEFKDKESRDTFEKKFGIERMFQYAEDRYDCFYTPTWMGYYEPQEMKKKFKELNINVAKFLSLDVGTNSNWDDELIKK